MSTGCQSARHGARCRHRLRLERRGLSVDRIRLAAPPPLAAVGTVDPDQQHPRGAQPARGADAVAGGALDPDPIIYAVLRIRRRG